METSNNSKVIEEERESDSTLGGCLDHFKIAQMYTTKCSPIGIKSTTLNTMTTHTRTVSQAAGDIKSSDFSFLNSKIKFKGQSYVDSKRSIKVNSDPRYSTFTMFETQRNIYDKFMLKIELEPKNQTNQLENLQLKQDQIEELLDQKKQNFIYYCERFGNPKSKPHELKFNYNVNGMTPYHVIRMGQIQGLMKKNKNETYLLWICQQALALKKPNDQPYENYDEILHLMQCKQHPAFEYLCQLIYWQRKHFNHEVKKQLS